MDLHGNSKKKEISPDGSPDKNVFDIQQGVSIGIFIKEPGKDAPAKVHHAELWGDRASKYESLNVLDIDEVEWETIEPQSSLYLFCRQDINLYSEYNAGCQTNKIFPKTLLGPNSHRDDFAIAFTDSEAVKRIEDFANSSLDDEFIRQKYDLSDNRDWQLSEARKFNFSEAKIYECIYRPFDFRCMLYASFAFDYLRQEVNDHLL